MKVPRINSYKPCSAALIWKQSLRKETKKEGDPCDVVQLLSTPDRDFLVRNNGDEVKIATLRGKIVLILFGVLKREELDRPNGHWYRDILEAYSELSSNGKQIEIVFVAAYDDGIVNDKELFDNAFSKMPPQWLAIPFKDSKTRYLVVKSFFRYNIYSSCVIVSGQGKILQFVSAKDFGRYGADWYPFTDERYKEINEEYKTASEEMSLNSLLGSGYVLSSQGEQVPISQLEGMVVGLYLFESWRQWDKDSELLLNMYKDLKNNGKKFEIVFVNFDFVRDGIDTEEAFNQETMKMPWLKLPFRDRRCRKLWETFTFSLERNELVIIGPDGVSEFHGLRVMAYYGIEAYPFTIDMAVELEKKMPRGPTLDSLLKVMGDDFTIKKGDDKFEEIPVCALHGRRILLYLSVGHCPQGDIAPQSESQICRITKWYDELKAKDRTLELIYVCLDDSETWFERISQKIPLIAFPDGFIVLRAFRDSFNEFGMLRRNNSGFWRWPRLIAFESDGRFLTGRAYEYLKTHGIAAYPFSLDEPCLEDIKKKLGIWDDPWK